MIVEGVVESFDDARGLGVVRDTKGERFTFHAVAIADGSRAVAVGATVRARRAVGHAGHDEVVEVEAR